MNVYIINKTHIYITLINIYNLNIIWFYFFINFWCILFYFYIFFCKITHINT